MVRRILRLVREEYNNCAAEGPGEDGEPVVARTASVTLPALKDILLATEDQKDKGYATPYKRLKNMVIQVSPSSLARHLSTQDCTTPRSVTFLLMQPLFWRHTPSLPLCRLADRLRLTDAGRQ